MSRIEKIITKFWRTPSPKDLSWEEFVKVCAYYGFIPLERKSGRKRSGGSSRKFFHEATGRILHLHKRHPDPTLLVYQIEDAREILIDYVVEDNEE